MSFFKLGGVRVKHCKNTAKEKPQRIDPPKIITLPMSMHIGAPAKPVVAVGDEVKVGQLVAECGQGLSSPIYSGVSGKVKKLEESFASNGSKVMNVVIESDLQGTLSPSVFPPIVTNREEFIDAVRKSGVVGLGGAGFPTYVKLSADPSKVDHLVINGAECEPYITSDTRTMLDDGEDLKEGIELVERFLGIKKTVIAIEKNKTECIENMQRLTAGMEGVSVKALPSIYPQGGEKVLVYHTLGRVIGEGKLPLDAGVIVINCTTLATIARYIKTGMPLVEKCVTVDGSAVAEPKNVIAPIGTPVSDLIAFCGGYKEPPRKILYGGPMMGIAIPDDGLPILKQTNAIVAMGEKEARAYEETACIKCGSCVSNCPFALSPCDILSAFNKKDGAALEKLKVNLCMECGCCSYVCPARKNLVQVNKLAKSLLKEYQMSKKEGGK